MTPYPFEIWDGAGAQNDGFASYPALKEFEAHANRPRLDTATTQAPSPCTSFTMSPCMTPRGSDVMEPLFLSNLTLPDPMDAKDVNTVMEEEIMDDPVSRVNSPVHKAARLAETLGNAEEAVIMEDSAHRDCSPSTVAHIEEVAPEPMTPRAVERSVPGTPRKSLPAAAHCTFTPPPLVPKSRNQRPLLLQALQKNDTNLVCSVLHHSPEFASEPFWDHDCEPPLCCAVRLLCSPSIIELLLEYGASNDTTDARYRTPAQILWEPLPWEINPVVHSMPVAHIFSTLPQAFGASMHVDAHEAWRQEVTDLLEAEKAVLCQPSS